MATYKVVKENKYVTIHNEFFEIPTLSFGAKGLLGYIISKPVDWKIRKTDLIKKSTGGKEQIEGYLLELMAHGFMNWFPVKDEEGKIIEWSYEVYEMPYLNPNKDACIEEGKRRIEERKARNKAKNAKKKKPQSDNPPMDKKPQSGYPEVDNPPEDNPPFTNKDNTKKDYTKKDLKNDDDEKEPLFEINIYAFNELKEHFLKNDFWDIEMLENIKTQMIERQIEFITIKEATEQARKMEKWGREKIHHYPSYFVEGILRNRTTKTSAVYSEKERKLLLEEKEKKEKEENKKPLPFYNWLEA